MEPVSSKIKLSVLLSGLRPQNWKKLYQSIEDSFSDSFELIIVSPYEAPFCLVDLADKTNIKFIQDWGSPLRCYQIALVNATGEFITWCADDGVFMPKALDIALKLLLEAPGSVLVGKYNEGADNPAMDKIDYYYPARHDSTNVPYVPKDCLMLMEGVIPRGTMIEAGGWDTKYECFPMGAIDLSIRLYNKGLKFIFQEEMFFKCSHMPGTEGDHAPVHNGQILRDQPLFKLVYSLPKSKDRKDIELDNWKKSPDKWARRFNLL